MSGFGGHLLAHEHTAGHFNWRKKTVHSGEKVARLSESFRIYDSESRATLTPWVSRLSASPAKPRGGRGIVRFTLFKLALFKLGLPVGVADELLPTSSTQRVPRKCWRPMWLDRRLAKPHVGFFRQVVSLAMVATQASQDTVLPSRLTTSRTRQNVVDRQFTGNRLHAAVLAREPVSLEDVAPVECDCRLRQPVKANQRDDLRNAKTLLNGPDAWIAIFRCDRSPIGPIEQLVRIGVNDSSNSAVDHRHRSSDRRDVHWLPATVQD